MSRFQKLLTEHVALQQRMTFSKDTLQKIRAHLTGRPACSRPDLCIFAAGSLARHETGRSSDLDLFFIGDRANRATNERSISRLQEIEAFADLVRLNAELELEPFSGDGRYLKIHELSDIIAGTGTAEDDSENLFTTRLLLLLESKPIAGDAVYDRAVEKVLEMYFRDGRGRKGFRPLFLLNDILRYWRTLCLNYERARQEPGKPWWKVNLNLKFPRKLTVFSTVLAIVATRLNTEAEFLHIAQMTPLERLAFALDAMDDDALVKSFAVVLDNYEEFLAVKSHRELEGPLKPAPVADFSLKAEHLNDFLHEALASPKLDRQLVRYVQI